MAAVRSSVEYLRRCGIPSRTVKNSRLDVLSEMARIERWNDFKSYLFILEKTPSLRPKLIQPFDKLRAYYIKKGLMKQANSTKRKILNFYRRSKNSSVPAGALDVVANYERANLSRAALKLNFIKLRFPQNVFNRALQKKLAALDRVRKKVASVFAIGSAKGIINGRRVLVEAQESIIQDLKRFTPPFKNKKNVALFKKDMRIQIINPLAKDIRKQMGLAKNEIIKNNILSRDNNFFLSKNPKGIDIEYYYPNGAIPMDRGGGR